MAARSNPACMHLSRNPPGPNTSCIEGFADSVAVALAAPSAALPGTAAPSSMGTYSRAATFARRLTFDSGRSPAGLDARFARNPPFLSQDATERPVTIAYPPSAFRPWPFAAPGPSISLDSGHLAVG